MIESGRTMADIKGAKARGVPEAERPSEARPGVAFIEVEPVRRISWDYGAISA